MKPLKAILWFSIALIVCVALGAWTTFDYGLRCTKCLADKHVVEEHFFGIPFFRSATDRYPGADYERIFGIVTIDEGELTLRPIKGE
jgi:hypothetical protein